jgi:hypothetical protein
MAVAITTPKTPKQTGKPNIASVYRVMDGSIHHARCHQRMTYQGTHAGGVELQFHCASCHERVILPYTVAARLPVATGGPA